MKRKLINEVSRSRELMGLSEARLRGIPRPISVIKIEVNTLLRWLYGDDCHCIFQHDNIIELLAKDLKEDVKTGDDLFTRIGYLPEHMVVNFDELPQQLKNEFNEEDGGIEFMDTPFTIEWID